MGAAYATDMRLYARFVDLWREKERPLGLNELAWEWDTGPMGEAKVAVTMKYMVEQGYAERTSPRGDQGAWVPTAKAQVDFPEGQQVLPADPVVRLGKGVTVKPDSGEDARSWAEDPKYVNVTSPEGRKALGRISPKPRAIDDRNEAQKPFTGYEKESDR